MHPKIKVTIDGMKTHAIDLETGASIPFFSVECKWVVGELPRATLHVYPREVNFEGSASVVVVCPSCRKEIDESVAKVHNERLIFAPLMNPDA